MQSIRNGENYSKSNFDYKLKGTSLEHVDKENDIQVIIDNKLKFEDHMNERIKTGNCVKGIIQRSFKYLDNKCSRNCTRYW